MTGSDASLAGKVRLAASALCGGAGVKMNRSVGGDDAKSGMVAL